MKTVRRTRTGRTRRTVRTTGLVALAAAAAFSLTACQDGGKDDDAASVSSSTKVSKDSGSQDESGAKNDTKNGSSNGTEANGTSGGGNGGADTKSEAADSNVKRKTCTAATNTLSFQQTGGSAPVILIKATNQDSERCDLYGYPFVGYPDAQSPIAVGGGKPQAVVSLEPGESAYAALSLEKGEGNNMHREKKLTVELQDRNEHGTGSNANLTAPGAGLALSDNSTVSYWNTTPELALQ